MVRGGAGLADYYGPFRKKTFLPIRFDHEHHNRSYVEDLGTRPAYRRAWLKEGWAERSQAVFDRLEKDFAARVAAYALTKPPSRLSYDENAEKYPANSRTQVPSDKQVPSNEKTKTKMLAMKHTSRDDDDATPRKKKKTKTTMLAMKHKATTSTDDATPSD